jgi:hypothetical protein
MCLSPGPRLRLKPKGPEDPLARPLFPAIVWERSAAPVTVTKPKFRWILACTLIAFVLLWFGLTRKPSGASLTTGQSAATTGPRLVVPPRVVEEPAGGSAPRKGPKQTSVPARVSIPADEALAAIKLWERKNAKILTELANGGRNLFVELPAPDDALRAGLARLLPPGAADEATVTLAVRKALAANSVPKATRLLQFSLDSTGEAKDLAIVRVGASVQVNPNNHLFSITSSETRAANLADEMIRKRFDHLMKIEEE